MRFTFERMLFVAFPSVAGGYAKICEAAKAMGFDAIAPRAGQGNRDGTISPSLKPADVRLIRDAGLDCLPWDYSKPEAIVAHAEHYHQLEDAGATGIIDDAELPWDLDPHAKEHAKRYGELVKDKVTVPVYDAPWPAIAWHPGYPEAEFRQWVDGRMVQAYWTEIGWSAQKTLDVMRQQWSGRDARLLPIGITYGRKEIAKWGGQLPPRDVDLAEFAALGPSFTGGWYSMEAAAPGALEAIAASLRPPQTMRAREPGLDLDQGGPAVPFAWADRAEWDGSQDERDEVLAWHARNRDVNDVDGAAEADTDPHGVRT